jgi:D-beta-D-heptose 7-phosphate kinase/D-beta-D-heptose 1-phosphate adenosyltransferase
MKKNNPRNKKQKVVVAVSGGFDPVHMGHTRLFRDAKSLGDELVVILNNDNWLKKKKGFDRVILTGHSPRPKDMSVCRELETLKPHIFANGGDRNKKDANKTSSSLNPEQALCQKLGIKMVFNVGEGGKIQSSSWLLEKFLKTENTHQTS